MKTTASLPEEFLGLGYFDPSDTIAIANELEAGMSRPERIGLAYLMESAFAPSLTGYQRIIAYQSDPVDLARDFVYKAASVRLITATERTRLSERLAGMNEILLLLRLWASMRVAIRAREKAEAYADQFPTHNK